MSYHQLGSKGGATLASQDFRNKNEEFIRMAKETNPDFFEELKNGQSPEYFVLSCSDSRVSPSVITQLPLGQMFGHRNIANQVVAADESFAASLFFAIRHLKVKKIIIKGHTSCGGVKAAMERNHEKELQKWVSHIQESLPTNFETESMDLDELSKQNVLRQVKKLKKHPIYIKYGQNVEVQGYLFHVESGELERLA